MPKSKRLSELEDEVLNAIAEKRDRKGAAFVTEFPEN
jgi:hypothetical protein